MKLKNFIKNNKIIYFLYFYVFSFVLKIFSKLIKVDPNSILFVSYGGKKYDDSPKVVYEYMKSHNEYKDFKFNYAFIDPEKYKDITDTEKIKIDTIKYYYYLLKSKYWITNSSVQRGLNFKDYKHKNILFMHGLTALKKSQKNFKSEGKQFKMVKPEYFDKVFIEGTKEDKLVLNNVNVNKDNLINYGLPRVDELLKINNDLKYKNKIKDDLGIPKGKKVILYAPTYREYNKTIINGIKSTNVLDLKKWEDALGKEYILLITSHYETANNEYKFKSKFVFDVSKYSSFNELLSISDILISDYSNIVFDNYIIEKPAFCFGYDYNEYSKKGRGFYTKLEDIYLDGIITDENLLINKIKNINFNKYKNYSKKIRDEFILNYGKATKKCIDKIFNDNIKILHINNNTDFGGQQLVFMNILRNINKEKYHIDLLVYDKKGPLTKEIESLGSNIYTISSITKHPFKHKQELKELLSKNDYDIIHQHASNAGILSNLKLGKKMGVKKIILHSHASTGNKKILHYILRNKIDKYADVKLACSDVAGKWMYKNDYLLFNNGIDINKYKYNESLNSNLRKKYKINKNSVVLGTVGRLDNNKNQKYIIDIFEEYHKINNNSYLFIIGDGYNKDFLMNYSENKKLKKKIIFTGNIPNTNELYNIMNIFLLTSFNEGLPVVLVEAQTNGLKCLVSNSISEEANITGNIVYMDITENPYKWAETISKMDIKRESQLDKIIKSGYTNKGIIKQLEDIYS